MFSAMQANNAELQKSEKDIRFLCEAVLQFRQSVQHFTLYSVSVRYRRLLRAGAQDAMDYRDEISVLLRKGIQLCEPE